MTDGGTPLRVALYIGQLSSGGAEGQVIMLAGGLLDRGHDVYIVTGPGSPEGLRREIRDRVVNVPDRPRRARWRFLRRFLRGFRPDVLHSHLSVANVFGTFAGAAEGVPGRIISLLSTDPMKVFSVKAAEFVAARLADRIMVNSTRVREVAIKRLAVSDDKIVLIYNGVDTDRFTPARRPEYAAAVREEADIPRDASVIGNVANFHPIKDHSTLLAAVAVVHKELLPEKKPYLLLVGAGPEDREIRRKSLELGVGPYVRYAGSVADTERFYGAMDIFALTSRAEGFSNAVLEAMASGLPCVVTDVGGNAEAVEDGINGYVVPPADARPTAEKLAVLLREADRRAEMGAAGRRAAELKFGLDKMVEATERVYLGLVN